VSIPIRFLSAPDDAGAAEALDRDPESVQETMIRDRFLASSAMTEWESILTGRSREGHARAAPPLVVADDRPRSSSKILAASPELRAALAAADHSRLTEAAHQWVGQYWCGWPRRGGTCPLSGLKPRDTLIFADRPAIR
jgi:hypothetical protein